MDYKNLLDDLEQHTEMYVPEATYYSAASFVQGLNAGNEWGLLMGFPEWLSQTRKASPNLAWYAMVLELSFPTRWQNWRHRKRSERDERAAIGALCSLLREFLAIRRSHEHMTIQFGTKNPSRRARRR